MCERRRVWNMIVANQMHTHSAKEMACIEIGGNKNRKRKTEINKHTKKDKKKETYSELHRHHI